MGIRVEGVLLRGRRLPTQQDLRIDHLRHARVDGDRQRSNVRRTKRRTHSVRRVGAKRGWLYAASEPTPAESFDDTDDVSMECPLAISQLYDLEHLAVTSEDPEQVLKAWLSVRLAYLLKFGKRTFELALVCCCPVHTALLQRYERLRGDLGQQVRNDGTATGHLTVVDRQSA